MKNFYGYAEEQNKTLAQWEEYERIYADESAEDFEKRMLREMGLKSDEEEEYFRGGRKDNWLDEEEY